MAVATYTARMRGEVERQVGMLTLVQPEQRIPADHPIRRIKALADAAQAALADGELRQLSPVFERMYAERGRPSIPPERLLKACLLIALYSLRSERQFCEQLNYNLLFRWFLDLGWDEGTFDASTFAKNKQRLLAADVARRFFDRIVRTAQAARLLSAEHFTVDGTLIEAWASLKSFRPRDEDPGIGLRPTMRVTPRSTSTARSARMRRTSRRRTRRPSWPAKARAKRPSSASRPTS